MNAFINENGILVSFGFMGSDNDNTLIPLPDDFSMTPGLAQYINGDWVDICLQLTTSRSINQSRTSSWMLRWRPLRDERRIRCWASV